MTKGLALARLFYAAGHNVIGADFEPTLLPTTCGRYSRALKAFYRLDKADGTTEGSARYTQSLLDIINREHVDLWVSCSGVASALDDGRAKETLELITSCKAVQFDVSMTKKLHEKHSFMDFTQSIGLRIPHSHHITSQEQAIEILSRPAASDMRFVMKFTGTDDSVRGDMTLLPLSSPRKTEAHIKRLTISESRPWILQQFISGPEYCTHALVINNKVTAFTACPSAELLMHYSALPSTSVLSRCMLKFTQKFASSCPKGFTGHLSFDFMVYQADVDAAAGGEVKSVPLWPIECNPRAHTAVVLFSDTPELGSKGYMKLFDDQKQDTKQHDPIYPNKPARYYWLQHDFVTLVVQPVVQLLSGQGGSLAGSWSSVMEFLEHLLLWRDGTLEIWDPLPAWVLWHISWPWIFLSSALTDSKWSRINVSTMKVFSC